MTGLAESRLLPLPPEEGEGEVEISLRAMVGSLAGGRKEEEGWAGITGGVLPPDDEAENFFSTFRFELNFTHCSDGQHLHSAHGESRLQECLLQRTHRECGSIEMELRKEPQGLVPSPGHLRMGL